MYPSPGSLVEPTWTVVACSEVRYVTAAEVKLKGPQTPDLGRKITVWVTLAPGAKRGTLKEEMPDAKVKYSRGSEESVKVTSRAGL